jgi:hypothetical protein
MNALVASQTRGLSTFRIFCIFIFRIRPRALIPDDVALSRWILDTGG